MYHALVLLLEFFIGEACSFMQGFAGAVVAHVVLEVVFYILVYLVVGDLDAIHLALVHQELAKDEVLENSATVVEGVGGTLFEAYLSIGALDVGVLDDVASHDGGDPVDDVVLGDGGGGQMVGGK